MKIVILEQARSLLVGIRFHLAFFVFAFLHQDQPTCLCGLRLLVKREVICGARQTNHSFRMDGLPNRLASGFGSHVKNKRATSRV
ncbi:hypothetical protein CEXT_107451 [Caerostris extrusa]|uniref:Secreted protein n=1 Tax=Caerostris extrusa TaxID=172846 RepID=A0AAV4SP89_CAEEX|nr:hypothetical protein CEXT_107451 [Caerostris extrusa]